MIRTKADCSAFNNICTLQMFNDMCRALCYDKSARDDPVLIQDCMKILRKIEAMNLEKKSLPKSYLEYLKFCQYIMLTQTLRDFISGNKSTVTVLDSQIINEAEIQDYWSKIDSLSSNQATDLIKKFTLEHCKILAYKCYSSTNQFSCNDCTIDSVFTCIGRPENLCGNSSKDKSTSFADRSNNKDICSHYILKSKGIYDDIIAQNVRQIS